MRILPIKCDDGSLAIEEIRNNKPAVCISWNDVHEFIQKLNAKGEGTYRLPTEAEWEYAGRAEFTGDYNYGSNAKLLGDYVWHSPGDDS